MCEGPEKSSNISDFSLNLGNTERNEHHQKPGQTRTDLILKTSEEELSHGLNENRMKPGLDQDFSRATPCPQRILMSSFSRDNPLKAKS